LRWLWVGVAGFFGAVLRYWLDGVVSRWASSAFPWGTFVINLTGCFVIGFLSAVLTGKFLPHPVVRTAVLVGFVGAYTTFSTFAYETLQLAKGGAFGFAVANIAASLVAGLLAVWLGDALGGAL
jgi:fluoride exporter